MNNIDALFQRKCLQFNEIMSLSVFTIVKFTDQMRL